MTSFKHCHRMRFRWPALLCGVALALLAGCGTSLSDPGAPPGTATIVASPTPRATLTWQQGSIPPNLGFAPTIAASDGRVAYLCATHGGQIQLWTSHDRAATWNQITSVPTIAANASDCTLAVDQNDAQTLVMKLSGNDPPTYKTVSAGRFLSTDGGKTWQRLPDTKYDIGAFASGQGKVYAIRSYDAATAPKPDIRMSFWMSGDHMQTWQEIDQAFTPHNLAVDALWLDPFTGDLLAQTDPAPVVAPSGSLPQQSAPQLWETANGGQAWSHVITKPVSQITIAAPKQGQPWQICAATEVNYPTITGNSLSCSVDGGHSWLSRPGLNVPHPQGKSGSQAPNPTGLVGIATNGDLLALDIYPNRADLYRLPTAATVWQKLADLAQAFPAGQTPNGEGIVLLYFPTGNDGVLWNVGTNELASALYP